MKNQKHNSSVITVIGTISGESRGSKRDLIEKTVNTEVIQESFKRFLQAFKGIVDVPIPSIGPFDLDEVEFTAELSANGDFKLLGTGVGVEAKGGVKFTLKRKVSPLPAAA